MSEEQRDSLILNLQPAHMSTTVSVQDGELESNLMISMADKAEEGSLHFDRDSSSTASSCLDETAGANPQTVASVETEISSAVPHVSINMGSDDAKLQQAQIDRIVAEKDSDSLQNFGGVQVIAEALGTDLENGLSSDGKHIVLTQSPAPGFFIRLLKACNDYTVLLLVLAAGLSLFFGFKYRMTDGLLFGVITITFIFGIVVQNMSGKQNPSEIMPRKVVVKRGGHEKEVSISDVFVGDIVPLERERLVPADGLFFHSGESLRLELDDGSTVDANNPFLYCGAKVTGGSGGMLVTSVGTDTILGQLMSQVTRAPGMTPILILDKVNTVLHIIGLLISILILLVLCLRFKLGDEHVKSKLPQLKGKPTLIMDAINKIFMKLSNGKLGALIATLTMSLLGVKGGIPYVISRFIDYWRKKMLSDRAFAQKPLAWLTMGSVSTICIDKAAWLALNRHAVFDTGWTETTQTSKEIEGLKNTGVNVILVSEDKVSWLEAASNGLVLEGENFRNYSDVERMSKIDDIIVMESCSASDKLLLVQCLKKKGKTVAMVGGKTDDIPALKEADVGLVMDSYSSEMARESADIIIRDDNLSFLVSIVRCGRCTYDNIRKYIQFELAMTIAGLLIPTITIIAFGYSPISVIQLPWTNSVSTFLGGLALMTEPPTEKLPPTQTEPLITKAMWRNIVSQALYQTVISVFFQSKGQAILGITKKVSETIIFNSFVLCQVFNIVNAREVEKKNVFRGMGIRRNPWFWVAVGAILVLQVTFIETAYVLIGYGNLNWVQWLVCLLIGMSSLATDWVTKWTSEFIRDWFAGVPVGSNMGTIGTTPSAPSESTSNVELPLIDGHSSPVPS